MSTDSTSSTAQTAAASRRRARSIWRPRAERGGLLGSRNVRRGLMAAFFLGLVALLGWLVFHPFFHPNAQLAFISGGDYHPLRAPPATFASEDFEGLESLGPALLRHAGDPGPILLDQMRSARAMSTLTTELADASPDTEGVLIVYVDGHGVSDNGTAWLLCRNYDPANPAAGRYRLRDLLHQMSNAPAAVKLLILDAGRIESNPHEGMIVNEFPRLLAQEVEQTGDPSLWVLSSNSLLERSHVSWALERSVFAYFVTLGLQGAADFDRTGAVNVADLHRFVAANVGQWVREATGGRETQTPLLFWGGGPNPTRQDSPVLLPVTVAASNASNHDHGLKLPHASGSLPAIPGGIGSARVNQAHAGIAPASEAAVKQVPGSRTAKKTLRTTKRASRSVERSKQRGAEANRAEAQSEPVATPNAKPDEKGAERPAATAAADAKAAPAGTAEKTAADGAEGKPKSGKAEKRPLSAAGLLADGWQLRDDFEAADSPRPIDYAPQAWREYQEWLLAQELLFRGETGDGREIAESLDAVMPRMTKLPNPPALDDNQPPDLAARIGSRFPRLPDGVDAPYSLAMAQLFADSGGAPLSADLTAAAGSLDRFTRDGSPDEFAAWVKKLSPTLDRYAENRWARQLARLSGVDWPMVQLALAVRQAAEQVATVDAAATPWIRDKVEAADRLRLAGERELTDAVDSDRQARATSLLRRAADLYRQASDDAALVASAIQLRNDLLNRAPYYVAWRQRAGLEATADAPRQEDLVELLDRAGDLDAALASGDPEKLAEVQKLTKDIGPLVDRIETGLTDTNINGLTSRSTSGALWQIELLLDTPLPNVEARAKLLAAAAAADGRVAANFQMEKNPPTPESPAAISPQQWRGIVERAKLELALARLAAGRDAEGAGLLGPLGDALTELTAARDRFTDAGDAKQQAAMWDACRKFGTAIGDFHRGLPTAAEAAMARAPDLSDPATRPARLGSLHAASRMLRLLNGREASEASHVDPDGVLAAAALHDLLVWQEQRLVAALVDAPPSDVDALTEAATAYRTQADRIPRQSPATALPNAPLAIEGPTAINLTTEPEQFVEFSVRSTSTQPTDVWLVLHEAPDLVEVVVPSDLKVYDEQQLRAMAAASGSVANAATVGADASSISHLPPTLKLRAAGSQTLRFKVRAKSGARQSTRLIVEAISAQATVRHEVEIALPAPETVELAVDGVPGSWTLSESRASLYPFANRQTNYQFSLVNDTPVDRTVDLELLALANPSSIVPPAAALDPDDAARLLARYGQTNSLAALTKVAVPAGGKPVAIPFAPPAGENKGAGAPAEGAAPAPAAAKAAPAAEGEAPPKPTPLDYGAILVITDRQSQLKTIKRIDIAPQRPRRFIHPQVGYNLDREQLQIRVTPQDKALLPPGGVKVHAEFATPLPVGTQAQLDGEIKAPDYEARLFADVPADAGKVLTLRLAVDGYPRAFVYHVPCGIHSNDVPEQTDLREIRILSPAPGKAFKAPLQTIPVDAEVDAPLGAFQNPDDVLEIGIDVDRDRELRGEPSVRLSSDRQVNVGLVRLAPGGVMTLDTQVGDFHLDVPAPALRNARVDVLGRLFAAGKTGYSDPVEIILDGAPPVIERVELLPPAVVIGPDVEVSVWATDEELSGVEKVEVAFDPAGKGKLGEGAEPVALDRDHTGRWSAKLPTTLLSVGEVTLLVQATDKVGNASDYTRVKCHVVTKAEAEAAKALTGQVRGTVFFGDDPMPQIQITLSSDKGPKIPLVASDARGNFTFANLPPGQYKLAAKGVIHDKIRKVEQDVTVESGSTNSKPVRIVLK